jgi:hypothetical protein
VNSTVFSAEAKLGRNHPALFAMQHMMADLALAGRRHDKAASRTLRTNYRYFF